jgi:hypothetical protein
VFDSHQIACAVAATLGSGAHSWARQKRDDLWAGEEPFDGLSELAGA